MSVLSAQRALPIVMVSSLDKSWSSTASLSSVRLIPDNADIISSIHLFTGRPLFLLAFYQGSSEGEVLNHLYLLSIHLKTPPTICCYTSHSHKYHTVETFVLLFQVRHSQTFAVIPAHCWIISEQNGLF